MNKFITGLLIAGITSSILLIGGLLVYRILEYIHTPPQSSPAITIQCIVDKNNNLICPLNNVTVYNVNGRLAK